jgi:chaperonin GroES
MNNINIKPLGSKMIVEAEHIEKTSGGIIIANAKDDGLTTGTVLAIGKGSYDERGKFTATETQPGTKILFNAGSGEKFKYQGKEYIWLHEDEIIGTL